MDPLDGETKLFNQLIEEGVTSQSHDASDDYIQPRLFIVKRDGTGLELLRESDNNLAVLEANLRGKATIRENEEVPDDNIYFIT
jgi:hypothetical protein